jgi:hypothetical protein
VELIKEIDFQNHGYDDAFRGTKGGANTNEELSHEEAKLKLQKREEEALRKKKLLFERYTKDIMDSEKKLPPVQVKKKKKITIKQNYIY